MRISFLFLLFNALFFTQILSAADDETQLKNALLKAMGAHDTSKVKEIANGGYESIDRDDLLQEKLYIYFEAEEERVRLAKEQAEADAVAKKQAQEKAEADALTANKAAEEKAKTDAAAAQKAADEKAKAEVLAKKQAQEKAEADALAAKKAAEEKAKTDAAAAQKAADEKAKAEVLAKKQAQEKAEADALAAKKAAEEKKKAAPAKAVAEISVPAPTVKEVKAAPQPAIAAPVAAAPVATAAIAPFTVSDKKLVGSWKQISSEKVNTLVVNDDSSFILEEVEDDGTLTLTGTWKSDQNIFMLSIKKVQRNVHSRETDIHRIYKVEELNNHRLVLRDQRDRIAYDLAR